MTIVARFLLAALLLGGGLAALPANAAPPTVDSIGPPMGSVNGGTVVGMSGSGFADVTAVDFGAVPATSFTIDGDIITAVSPAGAGTVNITVTSPEGTSATAASDQFTYVYELFSISPNGGTIAGGTVVTLQGYGFTGVTSVNFGSTPATGFTFIDDTEMTAIAPPGTGTVDITVTTPHGTTAVLPYFGQYTYVTAPAIVTSISPTSGSTQGGQYVSIYGSGLAGATSVLFGTTSVPVSDPSDTEIGVAAPAGTGTVDVRVVNDAGTSAITAADQFTYISAPVVSAVLFNGGLPSGGDIVDLQGSGFIGTTQVNFGSTIVGPGGFTVENVNEIQVTAPPGAPGTVDITVTTADGTSAINPGDHYTYQGLPTVTGVSPSQGPAVAGNPFSTNDLVTITGTNFVAALTVSFGTTDVNAAVIDATHVQALRPAGTGTVDVTVVTPSGRSVTDATDKFTYVAAPAITAIAPNTGPAAGGTAVAITGSGFTAASAVKFGSIAAASFTIIDDGDINAIAPAGTGIVDITVTTPGGTSTPGTADQFAYGTGPVISALSAAGGPPDGGNTITITGANFGGASSVLFGTAKAQSFFIANATQITAVAPAGTLGTMVDVTVTTPDGTSPVEDADKYTYAAPPTVTAISPNNGSALGGTPVTITGSKLTGATGVSFGTVAATDVKVVSDSTVTATAPAGTAGIVDVTVTTPGGPSVTGSADLFTYDGVATGGTTYAYASTLGTTGMAKPDNTHFSLPAPGAVDTTNNHLLVADTANDRVQILDSDTLAYIATLGTSGTADTDTAHLNGPLGVGFDPATGHILVADTGNDRIQIFDATSFAYVATLGTTGTTGSDDKHFNGPASVQLNAAKRQLYIADALNDRIQVFDADTLAYVATLGTSAVAGATNTTLDHPTDAELNPTANQIMVADSGNGRVQLFDAGTFAYVATIGAAAQGPADNDFLGKPVSASFDPVENLVLVADSGPAARVQVYDAMSYTYVLTLGTTGSTGTSNSQFQAPAGIAVDTVHDKLFIGDPLNDRIQAYTIGTTPILASVLPGSRSVQVNHPATIFASLVNTGTTALEGCQAALPVTAPAGLSFSYQTTNPATNALTGTPNTPATIAGKNGTQTFLLSFQGSTAFVESGLAIDFDCLGAGPALVTTGVDTVDLTVSNTAIADVIALAATATNNGIAIIPGSTGTGAFAVASDNVGATAQIIASVDTGTATLPVTPTICQSNPSTGACLGTPTSSVTVNFSAGLTPTFSIFLTASGAIPLDPANSRVFVRFKDASGALHGSTSVAVETQ